MGFDIKATARDLTRPRKVLDVTWSIKDERFHVAEEWVNFSHGDYENVDFRGQRFNPFHSTSSVFVNCDFRRVNFKSGSFGIMTQRSRQSVYRDCLFDGADLRRVHSDNARFEGCSFRNAKISGWRADFAEFIDCTFQGHIFDCRFAGRPWKDERGLTGRLTNEFSGNDFSQAELDAVMFVFGIDIDRQQLPTGSRYVRVDELADRIHHARAAVSRWPEDKEREDALFLLRLFSEGGYEEQASLFTDREKRSVPRDVSERVWDLMTRSRD